MLGRAAETSQWNRQRLPSSGQGFESHAQHLRFFQFIKLKLYICHLSWSVKRTKINKKSSGLALF